LKPKDNIYYFEIKMDFTKDKVEQTKREHKVIGANDRYICIDDSLFTSLQTKQYYRGDKVDFNEIKIYESHSSCLGDYIRAYLYTASPSEKIAYRRIKKALEKFIYEKHGRYCNAISFLDKIQI
jgi:hypothetical protein